MATPIVHLALVGGPADGFKLTLPQVPGHTVRMPAQPSSTQNDRTPRAKRRSSFSAGGTTMNRGQSNHLLALYDLANRTDEFDADQRPIIWLNYRFTGLCDYSQPLAAPSGQTQTNRWFGHFGLAWLQRLLTGGAYSAQLRE